MKQIKSKKADITILLQYESCDVSFHQFPVNYGFRSNIYDDIIVYVKVILSNFKSIKKDVMVEIKFSVMPYLLDDKSKPEAFGDFLKVSKKPTCIIFVPPTFPERLDFILNRGIKPYFDLGCIKEKYEKLLIKTFSMESKINIDDYLADL